MYYLIIVGAVSLILCSAVGLLTSVGLWNGSISITPHRQLQKIIAGVMIVFFCTGFLCSAQFLIDHLKAGKQTYVKNTMCQPPGDGGLLKSGGDIRHEQ